MKRFFAFAMVLLFLLSALPVFGAQEYVKKVSVFSGHLKEDQKLQINEYLIRIEFGIDGSPYVIIEANNSIKEILKADFGAEVETGNLIVSCGSYDAEKGLFIVVLWKAIGEEYKVEKGSFVKNFEVLEVNSTEITIERGTSVFYIKANESVKVDKYILEFTGKSLVIYELPQVTVKGEKTFEISVSFPYKEVVAKPGDVLSFPIVIENRGDNSTVISLEFLRIPKDWSAEFLYQGIAVRSIEIPKKSAVTLTLNVQIPEEYSGREIIEFKVNSEVHRVVIDVKGETRKGKVEVITSIISQDAEAGEEIKFPLVIQSTIEANVSVEIGVPEGWDAHSLYMGSRVSMIHLSEEDSKTLEISLDVPRGADLGRYEIPVTLSISGNEYSETKVVTFFVNIYKTYKGENATLNILIIDEEGNPVPKAKVIVGDKEMGTDSSGKAEISIKPGEYEIYVEKEGYEKASKKVEVEDGEVKDVKIILSRKPYYFAVDTESDVYSILLGTPNPPFLITIENLGKNSDEYRLSVRGLPENWNAMFTLSPDSNLEVNKVEVDPGQSKNVYLSVYPSLNALPGDYNLTIIVESISSGTKEEIPITVHLIGTYEMYVNLMNYRLSITAGEEKTTEIEVVNYGNAPVTNVKIEVSAPQGWKVEVDPDSAPMVAPKDRFTSTLKVKVPEGTPAGEYRVTIKVTSDQQEWQDTLRVVVRQRSTSAYIGLALLIVAFLVVIIMIRRVGRR